MWRRSQLTVGLVCLLFWAPLLTPAHAVDRPNFIIDQTQQIGWSSSPFFSSRYHDDGHLDFTIAGQPVVRSSVKFSEPNAPGNALGQTSAWNYAQTGIAASSAFAYSVDDSVNASSYDYHSTAIAETTIIYRDLWIEPTFGGFVPTTSAQVIVATSSTVSSTLNGNRFRRYPYSWSPATATHYARAETGFVLSTYGATLQGRHNDATHSTIADPVAATFGPYYREHTSAIGINEHHVVELTLPVHQRFDLTLGSWASVYAGQWGQGAPATLESTSGRADIVAYIGTPKLFVFPTDDQGHPLFKVVFAPQGTMEPGHIPDQNEMLVAAPGSSWGNPIKPTVFGDGSVEFANGTHDRWFAAPLADAMRFEMSSEGMFTGVLEFPPSLQENLVLSINGERVGEFGFGDSVDFSAFATGGVSEFLLSRLQPDPGVTPVVTVPLHLAFDRSKVDFLVTPVEYSTLGDLTADGRIDRADVATLAGNFGLLPAGLAQGDLDGDGTVGLSDLSILQANFTVSHRPSSTTIPEPSAACLAFLAIATLLFRSKRCRP
jgi:hypothetical protein